MKRHASMNRIYRLVWNQSLGIMVAVAENAKGRGKSVSGRKLIAAALALTVGTFLSPFAMAGPTGGQIVSGAGNISQSGATTNIQQTSQNLSLNWQSFNIAKQETVNFQQPSATAIAVNRIFDTNGTQILGHLNANGQIYLINPNGIIFGAGAQINVGGLVASTLDISSNSNGLVSFSGNGTGGIVNQGTINAANGGYIAFIGNTVTNTGTITAPLGAVGLGAGNAVTLTFAGNRMLKMQVDQSVLNSLVSNGGLIQANGGMVILTAGARDALLASVVNNTGIIEAQTVNNQNGTITLLGGMTAGTANVGGTLDASAPSGGNGGFIETSAHNVHIASDAVITTAAAQGLNGTWLIDPVDFTIAATGGDITGAQLGTDLGLSSITIQTGATGSNTSTNLYANGSTGTAGDINVNDTVMWSANTLTLNAYNNININAAMNGSGTAGLALLYGQGSTNGVIGATTASFKVNAPVNLASTGTFSTQLGSTGTPVNYTVITSMGEMGSTTASDLQGINGGLSGNYVLGANIDATATSSWNSGAGFAPISVFSGTFDGLGHTISNLTQNNALNASGLFSQIGAAGTVKNLGLTDVSISKLGNGNNIYLIPFGALTGTNAGSVSNVYSTGTINNSGPDYNAFGGLVGVNTGSISNAYSSATLLSGVWGTSVGGLVGINSGTISSSYAAGAVTGNGRFVNVGGLVGQNTAGSIANSYAIGTVSSGGTPSSNAIGGLVGLMSGGAIANAYAAGLITATKSGSNYGSGLIGSKTGGSISNSLWDTTKSNRATGIGYPWNSQTGVIGLSAVQMQAASNFTGFNFTTTPGATGNNWVMVDTNGTLNNAGSVLGATFPMLSSEYSTTINNAHQLQLMAMAPTASYTLGSNINAAATGLSTDVWGSVGFVPVGKSSAAFTGTFDGLGHTIAGLSINSLSNNIGLFGYTSSAANISNVGLVGGSVNSAGYYIGSLVGWNAGAVRNSYATGSVSGRGVVGGLVGINFSGSVDNSYATGNVQGTDGSIGGLVGQNFFNTSTPSISNSYATGNVSGSYTVGGLLGDNISGLISNSHATGNVTVMQTGVGSQFGGLVGYNTGTVSNSYAISTVTGLNGTGGLVGNNNSGGTVSNSYASGVVNGGNDAGGLVGYSFGGTVNNSYATSSVSGTFNVGGLVGHNEVTALINNSYATGSVTGPPAASGLVGYNGGTVSNSYWNSDVIATGIGGGTTTGTNVSGLASSQMMQMASFSSWNTATPNSIANTGGSGTVWRIYEGNTAPLLSSFLTSLTLANTSVIYNGSTQTGAAAINGVLGAAAAGTNVGSFTNGFYSTQQGYDITGGNLTITAANLTVSGLSGSNRVYNGSTVDALTGTAALNGLVSGESLTLGGITNGTLGSANAGSQTLTTAVTIANNSTFLASNYALTQPTLANVTISQAPLTYVANPASFLNGQTPSGLTGSISGFVATDTQGNATTGTLSWVTTAGTASQPGIYAIDGAGLSAVNYSFTQSLNNMTALTLNPGVVPAPVQNVTTQLSSNVGGQALGGQSANSNVSASNSGMSGASTTITVLPSTTSGAGTTTNTGSGEATGGASLSGGTGSDGNGVVALSTITLAVGGTGTLQIVNGGIKMPDNLVGVK